ncbi:ATP-binding protein [Candidatus Poriferisocius sp.]|uniref:ATP-binding protein n=1 Tax=Candidatus Poriferisocius sp. TaxID=3101276 RepID=UPI003B516139
MQRSLHLSHPPEQGHPSDALPLIEDILNEMAEEGDWPITLTMRANLVLEELVLNTLTHGDTSGLTKIDLELESAEHVLTICLTDDGAPFNPLTDAPEPDVTLPLAERPIGGLGVYLVRTMGEELEYRRENNRNHLKLVVHPES